MSKNKLIFDNRWSNFIRQCFKYKRKTLLNNLKVDYSIESINKKMTKMKLDSNTRAEELPVDTLFNLYQEMVK
jgi:16S rRNA A1518/A1519 N6-dimethyltransferase RsmA/KsgA/DIM1 with predicted DNA glycosylase/AP lyase activity